MRRWNGWGDESIEYPVPPTALERLRDWVGESKPPKDVTIEETLTAVGPSKLPAHSLVSADPEARLRHARGQSLPDWIDLRGGLVDTFPDGVAFPTNSDDLRTILGFAAETGAVVIPYGGGTSVVGHVNVLETQRPVLSVAMTRLNRLRDFDPTSMLATFEAGITGPELEAELRARSGTLGHFPQSFEYSTLGGWVATRSCGQQSLGYGRIEHLVVGARLETPLGSFVLPSTFPASAAGPDLRELLLGSEGRMGLISEVTVRASPLPENESFHGVFFPDFASGLQATRQMVQANLPLSLARLSTARETETLLALAGHETLLGALEKLLSIRGIREGKALLLLGFSGRSRVVRAARKEALAIASDAHGVHVGKTFGAQWHEGRFRTPYLRNTLWDLGYAVDTLETSCKWRHVPRMITSIEEALDRALEPWNEQVHVFTHLSHFYLDGASVYVTFLFRQAADPAETLARWRVMKESASQAIVDRGGTISHQHGVGIDHAPYLAQEKGRAGIDAIRSAFTRFDPDGIMNPGKLIMEDWNVPGERAERRHGQ